MPEVLRSWVRFALTKRGLEQRWIVEAEAAVDEFAPQFRAAMTDVGEFSPTKRLINTMLADGIDATDAAAMQRWIDAFNAGSIEDRDAILGWDE
jgi:hypothetical protein